MQNRLYWNQLKTSGIYGGKQRLWSDLLLQLPPSQATRLLLPKPLLAAGHCPQAAWLMPESSCNCPLCNSVRMIFPLFDTCNRCYFLKLYCSSRNRFRDQSYKKLCQEIRRRIALCGHVAGDKQMGRGREHQLLPQATVLLKKERSGYSSWSLQPLPSNFWAFQYLYTRWFPTA